MVTRLPPRELLIGVVLDRAMAIWPVAGSMVGVTVQPLPAARTVPACMSAADTVKALGS